MARPKVLVNFRVEDGKTQKAKPIVQTIDVQYLNGRVRTTTGDVFTVVRHEGSLDEKHYQFLAVE